MRLRVAADEQTPSISERTALLAHDALASLGIREGETVLVRGGERTVLTARRWADGPSGTVGLSDTDRDNVDAAPGDTVRVEPARTERGTRVTVRPLTDVPVSGGESAVRNVVGGHPLTAGDAVTVSLLGLTVRFLVESTSPSGTVVVTDDTDIRVADRKTGGGAEPEPEGTVSLTDLGGVEDAYERLRRALVLPLVDPDAVASLGDPDGALLVGATGTGKTSLGTALADAAEEVSVLTVAPGGEYHDGEVDVAAVREDAESSTPVVVFLDDLEVLAPDPDSGPADESSAPLARLVSDLVDTEGVSVLGATTDPESVAPALRQGGCLTRRVRLPTPDRETRREMLAAQFDDVPLDGISLEEVAARTNGFVAGDVAALASEAVHNAVARHDEAGTLGPEAAVGPADVEGALATVSPSGLEEFSVTRPDVDYDDIGGLTEVKRQLVRTVEWPLLYPDLFDRVHRDQPAGVLLYGPPGTGKTMLAKAVAASSDANFVAVSGPELFDRYVGASEQAVRRVFERAREAAPTVVFFDEVDALAARRDASDQTGVTDRVVSQLLTELDGIEPSQGVIPIGATNRPDLVDRALLRPGRFERVLEVPLPDAEARAEIFAVHLADVPVGDDVDTAALAEATEGYSGSDIAAVVREAGLLAMEESLKATSFDEAAASEAITVSRSHLRRALDGVGRSVTDEMRETYASYAADLRQ